MSAFDATIRVGEASVQVLEDEQGRSFEAHLILGVLAVAPVGPGQAIPIPLGILRIPLDKNSTHQLSKSLQEAEEKLQERPNIVLPGAPGSVEAEAKMHRDLTGGD